MVVQTAVWQHRNFTPYSKEYINEISQRQHWRWGNKNRLDANVFWDPSNFKYWDITDTNDYIYDWNWNWWKIWGKEATAIVNAINTNPAPDVPAPAPETPNPNPNPNPKPKNANTNRKKWVSNKNQDSLENRQQLMQQQIAEDNAARANRNQKNREQIYSEAVARYAQNPSSFTPEQRDLLMRVWEQIGISPEETAANILRWNYNNNPTAVSAPAPTVNSNSQPVNTQNLQPWYWTDGKTLYSYNFWWTPRAISKQAANDRTQWWANQYWFNYI